MPFSRTRGVCWIGSLLLAVWGNSGHAAGLGSIVVQSGFGQPLRASVSLIGTNNGDPDVHCIRARVASIDGSVSMTPKVGLVKSAGTPTIQISTAQNVNELALNVFVNIGCDVSVQRTYQILIDPAVALPTVEESHEPATQPDESTVTPMPAATFVSENASGDRASKHHTSSGDKSHSREAAPDRDTAPVSENKKPAPHHKTAKQSTHSVLRMSGLDTPIEDLLPDPGLKMSDQLSASAETDPQKLAEIKQEQARFAAYLRGEDPALTAEERLKAVQAEVEKLSAELARDNVRRKSDQAALESTQTESHKWIRSLQVLLAICLVALAWLLWRFYAIKRDETYTSWRDLLGEHKDGAETTTSQLGENSSFNTSTFGSFDTGTSTFGTGAFSTTDISTFIPTTEAPAATAQADAARESQREPAGTPPETHLTMRGVPRKEKAEATPEAEPVPFRYDTAAHMPYTRLQQTETRHHDPENALKAEEISDVMELANVWMALHDPQKVLELLEPFSGVEQPESPLPWLCLLDVYHSIGDREKYEAILERIKKIYNVRLAPWDTEVDAEPPKTLADFPHIVDTVLNLWEGDGIIPYLDELMKDNREGTRQGFDLPVYRDLIRLLTLAENTQRRKREDAEREIADAISAASHRRQVALDATTRSKAVKAAPEATNPETSSPGRKPQLRERPKYITTSYQRNLSSRGNAPVAEKKLDAIATATEAKSESAQEVLVEPIDVTVITHEASASVQSADEETKHDYDSMSPMVIKLHLAIAYVDIGDKEGALLLLEEVIQGGNAEQIEQAKSLLTTLR